MTRSARRFLTTRYLEDVARTFLRRLETWFTLSPRYARTNVDGRDSSALLSASIASVFSCLFIPLSFASASRLPRSRRTLGLMLLDTEAERRYFPLTVGGFARMTAATSARALS